MIRLDFAIVGAPKAGTSSLYTWLNAHPQIQGSEPKETFFFMDDSHPLTARNRARGEVTVREVGLEGYERFFPDPTNGRLRFEATTHHFYQETALMYFKAMTPPPLIVFVLRRPSDRIRSSFQFTQENLGMISRELTFDAYVDYLLDGKHSNLDQYYLNPSSLHIAKCELELSRYVEWLERWETAVGNERLEIVLFEELKRSPRAVTGRLASRLGVDEAFWDGYDFNARNRSIWVRYQGLHRLARHWVRFLPVGTVKSALKRLYFRVQSRTATNIDTTSRGIARLDSYFAPWNRKMAKRFGLDLKAWR